MQICVNVGGILGYGMMLSVIFWASTHLDAILVMTLNDYDDRVLNAYDRLLNAYDWRAY